MNTLTITGLCKHFGGLKAVDKCSFSVRKGTITALIGPNGSGKSTVFNLISGVLEADGGSVKLGKEDLLGKEPHRIASMGISRMFQHTRLIKNLTVEENLTLALDRENTKLLKNVFLKQKSYTKEAQEALAIVKMESYAERRGDELSFGQGRLVELARSIVAGRELLLLDEPVGGVNPQLRGIIKDTLKELRAAGDTVLLIEHDMQFVLSVADEVIVMDEGRVITKGKPEAIRKNKRVIEAYLGD